MAHYITAYLVSVPIFFLLDMIWLGVVARSLYQNQLGHLLGPVNWPVAIIFYLVFLVGLTIFATLPALEKQSLHTALVYGALFGFFTYATYDLTNWSTIKDWPAVVSLIDMVWGTVLAASVSGATYLAMTQFFGK